MADTTSVYPNANETTPLYVNIDRQHPLDNVDNANVRRITCHRLNKYKNQEEYLVEWRCKSPKRPYSWHIVPELTGSLQKIQKYIDRLHAEQLQENTWRPANKIQPPRSSGVKRKSPGISDSSLAPSSSDSSSPQSSQGLSIFAPSYNGTVKHENGLITIVPWPSEQCFRESIPTHTMELHALNPRHLTSRGEYEIRKEFCKKLSFLRGPPITLDVGSQGAPSLYFQFISDFILRDNIQRSDPRAVDGCGFVRHGLLLCNPNMGQNVGCEYSRICDCLEYAPVDTGRLNPEYQELLDRGETIGVPKRFPYGAPSSRHAYCLVDFYLDRRDTIYECNPNCNCGPNCKTRVVQKGRQVPLEIFKTENRGWGLRCPERLLKGQFIDTYLGEIITLETAEERESTSSGKAKASYLYDLDKNSFDEEGNKIDTDHYVVDGEFFGNATRFMNHSCDPNCGQYVVSKNKYDTKIYDLAFFAKKDIPPQTELTFDYLDKDEGGEEDEQQKKGEEDVEGGIRCFCGAQNCRRWLWR